MQQVTPPSMMKENSTKPRQNNEGACRAKRKCEFSPYTQIKIGETYRLNCTAFTDKP